MVDGELEELQGFVRLLQLKKFMSANEDTKVNHLVLAHFQYLACQLRNSSIDLNQESLQLEQLMQIKDLMRGYKLDMTNVSIVIGHKISTLTSVLVAEE